MTSDQQPAFKPHTYTPAQQHRLGFILDIYDGMESLDQAFIEAGNGFALYGAKPPYSEALIELCAAPHVAAMNEDAWFGEPNVEAVADIERVMADSVSLSEPVQKTHELGAQSIADLYGDMEDGNGEKCTSIAELKAAISAQPQDHFPDVGNMIPPVVSPQTSDRPTMVSLLRQLGYTVIPPKGDVSFPTAYSPCLSKSAETDTQEDLSIAPDAKSGGEASPIIGDGDPREAVINTLRLELEELHAEAKDIEEAHADDARMIDRIADLIGLPQDQELSTVAFELWFSEQRSALPTQAEVGVEWQWRYTDLDKWETANSPIDPVAISELKLETRTLYLHPAPASSELIREIERIIALPESNRKDSAREYWKARVEYIQGCLSDALDKAKAYWRDGR